MAKVVVGISGGVDSSVSALLLKEAGHQVIGLYMKNWEEKDPDGTCHASEDYEDARRVSEILDIPFYSVNFVQQYWASVFQIFLSDLKRGYTPNPDTLCNREIKFKVFFEKAMSLGADFLATGHYCQTNGGQLFKGADPSKDQSYFLYALKKDILKKVLFPIGHLPKQEVRRLAREAGLPTHDKKDSTGICFIGKRNFKEFVSQYIPYHPGPFKTLSGKTVGNHDGAAYYTIGQRKGLNIGGPGDAWFVVKKDMNENVVFVEQGADHPALYASSLSATELSLIEGTPLPQKLSAKIRYRQKDQPCSITSHDGDHLTLVFDTPQRAITPHQALVLYEGEKCLGGALIV